MERRRAKSFIKADKTRGWCIYVDNTFQDCKQEKLHVHLKVHGITVGKFSNITDEIKFEMYGVTDEVWEEVLKRYPNIIDGAISKIYANIDEIKEVYNYNAS